MANPQTENGFTQIANELLEALGRIRIPGEARQVLDVIVRKTYGFGQKEDAIALSQLCKHTGLNKPAVCRGLAKLRMMNLIIEKDNDIANIRRINKDYDTWKPLSKKITHYRKRESALSKKRHTIETFQKKNNCVHLFNERFWPVYPKKQAKKSALKAWLKLKADAALTERVVSDVRARARSEDWTKDKGQYIPLPATYLKGERWEDETQKLQEKFYRRRPTGDDREPKTRKPPKPEGF